MKTDRELLELAAKAAGISIERSRLDDPLWKNMLLVERNHGQGIGWNPLNDDGDAFRLASKLKINIEHMKTLGGDVFGINCWPSGRGDCGSSEDGDLSDYEAATRRAIVRAAAAMGDKQ